MGNTHLEKPSPNIVLIVGNLITSDQGWCLFNLLWAISTCAAPVRTCPDLFGLCGVVEFVKIGAIFSGRSFFWRGFIFSASVFNCSGAVLDLFRTCSDLCDQCGWSKFGKILVIFLAGIAFSGVGCCFSRACLACFGPVRTCPACVEPVPTCPDLCDLCGLPKSDKSCQSRRKITGRQY